MRLNPEVGAAPSRSLGGSNNFPDVIDRSETNMLFKNRQDAGQQLAKRLAAYGNRNDVVVLGIPRGGVSVAFEVAAALHAPLDIFLSRKLGVPGHEELAFGALAAGDGRFIDQQIVGSTGISSEQIERITKTTQATLQARAMLYRDNQPPLSLTNKIVILIDDGIATGASIYAAIRALRKLNPKKLVVAAPVAPLSTFNWLQLEADQLEVLTTPPDFYAVGQFYESFPQVSDQEVVDLLHPTHQKSGRRTRNYLEPVVDSNQQYETQMDVGGVRLAGTLSIPNRARGLVLFAHGSGSSRHSPRNQYVAKVLQSRGLATLLFDLLTPDEERIDQLTSSLRFDIPFLAARLIGVTQWSMKELSLNHLSVGYFGASTGAAAALVAAAQLSGRISAVVSRGGRPDLAGEALGHVNAATLLIVGDLDTTVLNLNRRAFAELRCNKQLALIPGATHLFEEPGALAKVARLAGNWFVHHLHNPAAHEKQRMVHDPNTAEMSGLKHYSRK